jgi:murein DD-endopeptidase MepM/ murein hydrolase activator NlpD
MSSITLWHRRALAVACAAIAATVSFVPQADAHETTQRQSTTPSTTALAACPVGGSSEYTDSWGDPRSGGRRHEGVDMEAERGTPVLAVRSGAAEFKRSSLGGNAVWLVTATGERFYYAHLDAWEGQSRQVGNAAGDHLHFEVRLGDHAINPYPLVVSACSGQTHSDGATVFSAPTARLAAR